MNNDVFLVRTADGYPDFPYDSQDHLLAALRSIFTMWGKDADNPFVDWIGPGSRVVIKPNLVFHHNPYGRRLDALVTHSSLIKHLIDLLAIALKQRGSIVIGDAPIQSCDFQALVQHTRLADIVELARRKYPGLDISIEDWRLTLFDERGAEQKHRVEYEDQLNNNYEVVNLGQNSFLEDLVEYSDRFRVTCYDPQLMASHHNKGKHEYLVTKRVFDADLLINLPKWKTHIKAGLTGALKNLVGINGHKEFLPHHISGSSDTGGDCYYKDSSIRRVYDTMNDEFWTRYNSLSAFSRRAGAIFLGGMWRASRILTGDPISTGSWQGNETVWRMTLDLNHLLYFGSRAPKRIITIVDGIIAGEGEGPLLPTPKPVGFVAAGDNPAYVDATLAKLMGYNVSRVPTIYHAIYHRKSQFGGAYLENFCVHFAENGISQEVRFADLPNLRFVPPAHWRRAASECPQTTSRQPQSDLTESA